MRGAQRREFEAVENRLAARSHCPWEQGSHAIRMVSGTSAPLDSKKLDQKDRDLAAWRLLLAGAKHPLE